MQYDVFICHASEDKEDFVRPLAELLQQQHIEVWYDEFSLTVGDSLSQKIDEGLAKSKFGIVVLSPSFFKKPWAKRELSGLTVREMIENRELILPIWHRVNLEDVAKHSLPLADKKAISSTDGINSVLRQIAKKVKPDESPLVIARNELIRCHLDSPPISDEWWLDIIEFKEFLRFPDLNVGRKWIFPLPYKQEERGLERGMNIASAAMQMDWAFEGEELNICCTTHPEKVHDYIRRWPGLLDCARENAGVLALYVPQLTIPGFDSGFEDVFDKLMEPGNKEADRIFSYGSHDTIDGKDALCGDVIALRHPTFGNYTVDEIGYWYFSAHDTSYSRSVWDLFEGLVWLLSDNSNWLPDKYRETLIRGICKRDSWMKLSGRYGNAFYMALLDKKRNEFKMTPTVKRDLKNMVKEAIANLGIRANITKIADRMIDVGLVDGYYDFQDYLKKYRKE